MIVNSLHWVLMGCILIQVIFTIGIRYKPSILNPCRPPSSILPTFPLLVYLIFLLFFCTLLPLSSFMLSLPSKRAFVDAKSVTVRSKAVRLMKSKTVPNPTKSKTVANPFLLLKNFSHPNPKLAVLPLAVLLIIHLVLLPIPLILFPTLIQTKLALYQHPGNNLWTDGLL